MFNFNSLFSLIIFFACYLVDVHLKETKNYIKSNERTMLNKVILTVFVQNTTNLTSYLTYYDLVSSPCSKQNCDSPNGDCKDSNTCMCNNGFLYVPSFLNNTNTTQYCFYNQKNQGVSFLLELFFIIGIGHFYSGRILQGILKLLFVLFIIIYDCSFKIIWRSNSFKTFKKLQIFSYVLYFFLLLTQMTDLCLYGLNKYSDGNGLPLKSFA